jgi:hypothetical protein
MPALAPYIPTKDSLLALWAANFATLLSATPMLYGQTAAVATTVATVNNAFQAAYLLITSTTTKTQSTVSAKNTARFNMLQIIRPIAQQISLNPGVTTGNKVAIGVNPRTSTPTPITTPTTNPVLTIATALPLQHIIRYRDSIASPSVKSKPYGVIQLQLFAAVSGTPITNPALLPQVAVATKSPFLYTWPSSAKGMTAYYAGAWVIRKGLVGPFGPIVNFVVAG